MILSYRYAFSNKEDCFFFQDFSSAGTRKADQEKEILDISVTGAVFFIVTASIFLLLLFYFMSSWFVWVLTIFFCIGGMQVISLTSGGFEPVYCIYIVYVLIQSI